MWRAAKQQILRRCIHPNVPEWLAKWWNQIRNKLGSSALTQYEPGVPEGCAYCLCTFNQLQSLEPWLA